MITVEKLSKRYSGQEILHHLTFEARPGEITLLIGANGVGKTTTLKILSGLLCPDQGDAFVCGRSIVRERSAALLRLSYLPQTFAFHPRLTCEAVLRFYAGARGLSTANIDLTLWRVGLTKEARKPVGQLSGGLCQRLGLAVLLQAEAPVLLLDEPGLSLDPEWRAELQELLQEEAEAGKTVLVTTHLLGEWEGAAHRGLLCRQGGVIVEIDPHHLREEFAVAAKSNRNSYESLSVN